MEQKRIKSFSESGTSDWMNWKISGMVIKGVRMHFELAKIRRKNKQIKYNFVG
jgi:hypothetical protein